jgi:formylglycine-generating enzyme required for sulfatase activity
VHYSLAARDLFGDSAVSTGTLVAPPPRPAGMVLISGGTFQMGSTTQSESDEQPVHTVTVSDFWLDTTEVTQKEYGDLMSSTYSGYSSPNGSSSYGVEDNNPAYYVNWYDAVLYCNARTKASGSSDTVFSYTSISGTPGNDCVLSGLRIDLTKNGYRLPTEAQWEYACRAGTTTDYYWGGATIGDYAWYSGNSGSKTHAVAQKLPNSYGLYDMSGNVWEWCNDWYGSYGSGSETDPEGPGSGSYRVIRGGSWNYVASYLRSANRDCDGPDGAYVYIGFRVALPAQ